jgi:hypothetical protein
MKCAKADVIPYTTSTFPRRTLEALDFILSKTDATLVLSSTWRCDADGIAQLLAQFQAFGGKLADITSIDHMTDPVQHSVRQHEIIQYLDDLESPYRTIGRIKHWVSLDDDDSIVHDERYKSRMVQHAVLTNSQRGLTMENAKVAVGFLGVVLAEERKTVYEVPRHPEFNMLVCDVSGEEHSALNAAETTVATGGIDFTGTRVYSGGSGLLSTTLVHLFPTFPSIIPAPLLSPPDKEQAVKEQAAAASKTSKTSFFEHVQPTRVAELGAGLGVLSALCSRLDGVADVVCTDGNVVALDRARRTTPRGPNPVRFEVLFFGEVLDANEYGKFGLILCSELMYFNVPLEELVQSVSGMLDKELTDRPPMVLMAHVFRVQAHPRMLAECAEKEGMVALSVTPEALAACGFEVIDGVVAEPTISPNASMNILVPTQVWDTPDKSAKWGRAGELLQGCRMLIEVVVEQEQELYDDSFLGSIDVDDE